MHTHQLRSLYPYHEQVNYDMYLQNARGQFYFLLTGMALLVLFNSGSFCLQKRDTLYTHWPLCQPSQQR